MRYRSIMLLVMIAGGVSLAQLLPQRQAGDLPKIDRAMIFKLDHKEAADSSRSIQQPLSYTNEKGHLIRNSLIWAGLCLTGAALSSVFDSHQMIDCRTK